MSDSWLTESVILIGGLPIIFLTFELMMILPIDFYSSLLSLTLLENFLFIAFLGWLTSCECTRLDEPSWNCYEISFKC